MTEEVDGEIVGPTTWATKAQVMLTKEQVKEIVEFFGSVSEQFWPDTIALRVDPDAVEVDEYIEEPMWIITYL